MVDAADGVGGATLAGRLRQRRLRAGMTQHELAERAGSARELYATWNRGAAGSLGSDRCGPC